MANLKTQFSEMRKSTPKHVQWLLLAAAFIVVLILLTLLLRGDKKQTEITPTDTVQIKLNTEPESVDWTTTAVGETRTQLITLSSNLPVKVDAVRIPKGVPGLSEPKQTCTNIGQIADNITCTISVEYAPTAEQDVTAVSLFIDWRGAGMPENMGQTTNIVLAIGAVDNTPIPVVAEPVAQTPKQNIQSEIEAIAPLVPIVPFEKLEPVPELPVAKSEPVATPPLTLDGESCSDFAFPGYGATGNQIGWIRPTGGTYMFHPFSDKNCDQPTGTYNPDNGIITDISNPGRKLGTDAEHIGYGNVYGGALPQLSNTPATKTVNRARQLSSEELTGATYGGSRRLSDINPDFVQKSESLMKSSGDTITSSQPYDRTFLLRQYKPIPATIVSEVRADTRTLHARGLPVRATVDRHVYSDNGRTIIIPSGTLLLGYVTGDMPGPYKTIGRMEIEWYQFIRPDGVEFNFAGSNPFSGDSQGRVGVPGHGSSDYLEQFVMPMLTAIVPAAVNLIAPISDRFINQIDLDNNTVTQSGQVRSSELAKNEIITAWNQVAQKLLVDMMDNTVPPFSIAAGTRITVFSPVDLMVTCGPEGSSDKSCAIAEYGTNPRQSWSHNVTLAETAENAGSLVGQVRSFNLSQYCDGNGNVTASATTIAESGYDYRTVLYYCQSSQYKAINNAKQEAVFQNQQQTTFVDPTSGQKQQIGSQGYNEQALGLTYKDDGTIQNPFQKLPQETPPATITCEDGTPPDANGCCTGETFTDMGEQGFNCCPAGGGDCFPPIL